MPHQGDAAVAWRTPRVGMAAGLAEKPAEKREVARAPGYLRPDDFLALFRFVRDKGYETKSFRDYLRAARG